eukprot:GFUD01134788.1.p1 GENE.GFUD01134788.1~~GFUD01134788.1.p1  ORF type:complete len:368 (+),score=131.28 GFUD01134788.1:57-1160(+)
MNVRLKLANKEQKTCSSKMPGDASDQDGRKEEVVPEDKEEDKTPTEAIGVVNVGNLKSNLDGDKHEHKDSLNEKKEEELGCNPTLTDQRNNNKHAEDEEHSEVDEQHSTSAEVSKSEEIVTKDKKEKVDLVDLTSSSDESDHEQSNIASKLEAEALSASLSSSKCFLKRNRDDLDSDDEDSEGEKEEPECKKSNLVEITPKLVSKLKSSELLASMSSSKSLLKRGIEKVDKDSKEEKTEEAPESKKSNLAQTSNLEKSSEKLKEVGKLEPSKENESPNHLKPSNHNRNAAPKVLKFPESPCPTANEVKHLSQSPKAKENHTSDKKEEPVKEEVRQKIGAKEIAGQRQLERKRLNKMLSIFDDQKIVK